MAASSPAAVAVVGGTGPMGRGLAARWAAAGVRVWLGSRSLVRAEDCAAELMATLPPGSAPIVGMGNQQAVDAADLVVMAVPYAALGSQLAELTGLDGSKVLVSTAVPMEFEDGMPTAIHPPEGSAAQRVQAACPGARVVGALHTVAAGQLLRLQRPLDEDVLICGDDRPACDQVAALVAEIPGLRPVLAGGLASAAACEGITPLLLTLNRIHRARTGVRITGI